MVFMLYSEKKNYWKKLHHVDPIGDEEIIACINVIDQIVFTINRSDISSDFEYNPFSIKTLIGNIWKDVSYHIASQMEMILLSFILSAAAYVQRLDAI